ncbi:MAG: peptide-methionine (S)-S-oxide reductase MsrA [Nanoarchaeota archaeon]|nr:peptide-methionine (S)-S-oxide reductase MsrA [Nanoarchaeota archaeon]MBU1005708.1 peptide-methionine (S)-S-oxide reductase MsrA [Nanoarchaeota archaeon]MBU1946422.1 peptide-methionine (S)-S-oxide reductase MsrA [Nanoarchaeota archaeon]
MEKATFGAGCFWSIEEAFRTLKGVKATTVGYMGGKLENPSYEDVCTDTTGHVEVVQLEYDPKLIKYEKLLTIFWKIHNPTTPNRQGFDIGTQYRSVIFYHTDKQKEIAEKSKKQEQKKHTSTIVTIIEPAREFWKAEDYHQKYLMKRGAKTCH